MLESVRVAQDQADSGHLWCAYGKSWGSPRHPRSTLRNAVLERAKGVPCSVLSPARMELSPESRARLPFSVPLLLNSRPTAPRYLSALDLFNIPKLCMSSTPEYTTDSGWRAGYRRRELLVSFCNGAGR